MLSTDDFYAWKSNPVTQAYFQAIREKVYEIQVTLGYQAGDNPLTDKWLTGQIYAYHEMLTSEPEEVVNVSSEERTGPQATD